jgi:hypothetical protein
LRPGFNDYPKNPSLRIPVRIQGVFVLEISFTGDSYFKLFGRNYQPKRKANEISSTLDGGNDPQPYQPQAWAGTVELSPLRH